jgi:maltose-binding protein MalE
MDQPNKFKIITIAIGIVIGIFAILVFSGKVPGIGTPGATSSANKPTIDVWGTLPEAAFNAAVSEMAIQTAQPMSVAYTYIEPSQFTDALARAAAINTAPDIVVAEHDLLLSTNSLLYPMAYTYMSELEYKDTFVDTTHQYALPFGALFYPVLIDPMITFYNRGMLSQNGFASPIKTWSDLARYQKDLTVYDQNGKPKQSAFAIGAYRNISYAKDMLMTQLAQLGHTPVKALFYIGIGNQVQANINTDVGISTTGDDTVPDLVKIMRFQSAFSDTQKTTFTWSETGENDMTMFSRGQLAFYFARASALSSIRAINQNIDVGITYFPQFENTKVMVTGGAIYGAAVVRTTSDPEYSISVARKFSDNVFSSVIANILGMSSARRDVLAGSDGSEKSEILGRSALIILTLHHPSHWSELCTETYFLDVNQ